jgi:hypothetical protein
MGASLHISVQNIHIWVGRTQMHIITEIVALPWILKNKLIFLRKTLGHPTKVCGQSTIIPPRWAGFSQWAKILHHNYSKN